MIFLNTIDELNYYYDYIKNRIVKSKKKLVIDSAYKINTIIDEIFDNESYIINAENTRQQLILSITESCNLRCRYCTYYDTRYLEEKKSKKNMTFEIAKLAIDNFLENSKSNNNIAISFYGGEPLLNIQLIKKCIDYIENLNVIHNVIYTLTTNGYSLTNDIIEYFVEKNIVISVSLDGPRVIHDRFRKDINNNNTFEQIINNLLYVKRNYNLYFINNIRFSSVIVSQSNMQKIYDFFELLANDINISAVEVTHFFENFYEDIKKTDENYHNSFILEDYPNSMHHEIHVKNRIKKILSDGDNMTYIPGGYCKPLIRRTYVDIDGNYYCCEKINQIDSNTLGDVFNDIDYNKVFLLKDKVNTYIKDNCSKCWAFRFCDICFTSFLNGKKMNEKCNEIRTNYLHMLKLITYDANDVKELV